MPDRPAIDRKALKILRDRGPMRASDLGWELWGDSCESAMRGEGSHRQNKFCRPAGKVLNSLRRAGLADWKPHGNCCLWYAIEAEKNGVKP